VDPLKRDLTRQKREKIEMGMDVVDHGRCVSPRGDTRGLLCAALHELFGGFGLLKIPIDFKDPI
jgi:hypothetical protein